MPTAHAAQPARNPKPKAKGKVPSPIMSPVESPATIAAVALDHARRLLDELMRLGVADLPDRDRRETAVRKLVVDLETVVPLARPVREFVPMTGAERMEFERDDGDGAEGGHVG